MNLEKCPICGGGVELVRETREFTIGRRPPVMVDVELYRCSVCGEEVLTPEQAQALHDAGVAKQGIITGEEIRALRESLGLEQAAFEQLLGLGKNTVSRWENGHIVPGQAAESLLRLLQADRANAERLAKLHGVDLPAGVG